MTDAAKEAENVSPPWWVGEIVGHERRSFDIAVLTLRPSYLLPFVPGQSIGVSHPSARAWRFYSPANAPRADGTLEFHVRAAPGGAVSSRLVYGVNVGDQVHLASPVGDRLALSHAGGSDLLLLAGGTGWAPLKSLVEQVAAENGRRRVHLYVGARSRQEFYDSEAIDKLTVVVPVVDRAVRDRRRPRQPVRRRGRPSSRRSPRATGEAGTSTSADPTRWCPVRSPPCDASGYHAGQVHHEGLGDHWYGPNWRTFGEASQNTSSHSEEPSDGRADQQIRRHRRVPGHRAADPDHAGPGTAVDSSTSRR